MCHILQPEHVSIPSFQHVAECTSHGHCTPTSFLPCSLSFFVCPQTDRDQLYNTQSDLCIHIIWPLVFNRVFIETSVIMTSHMVADTSLDILHGSGAQFVETAGSSKPQIHKGDTERPA